MDDLISRQAAIDELGYCQTYLFDSRDKDKKISLEDAEYAIEQLPSAQPETARRIVGKSRDGMTLWYQCDMCNEPVDKQDVYCRGCGRRFVNE